METSPLKFIYIGRVYPDTAWHNRYSVHPHHELIIVHNGIMHVSGYSQQLELHSGEAALYPAGVQHLESSDPETPVESSFIVFEEPSFSGEEILVNRNQGTFLCPMASALYEHFITGEPALFLNEYLELMLKIFRTSSFKQEKNTGIVGRINGFIHKNLANPITLSDLAGETGLSKYHFLHQCRKESGKTPIQILWEIRCSEAVSLLKYTDLPMKEVALRTGFATMAHFSRRIKLFCGNTPGELRSGKSHRTAISDNY